MYTHTGDSTGSLTRVSWAQTQGLTHRGAHIGLLKSAWAAWWKYLPLPPWKGSTLPHSGLPQVPQGVRSWCCTFLSECLCSGHRSPPSHPPSLLTTRRDHSRIWKLSRVDAKKRDCLFHVTSQVDLAIGLSQASLPGEGRGGEWRGTHSLPGVLPQEAERLAPNRGVVFHAKCRCCVWATDADERWQNRPVSCLLLLTPGRAVGGPWSLFWP